MQLTHICHHDHIATLPLIVQFYGYLNPPMDSGQPQLNFNTRTGECNCDVTMTEVLSL